MEMGSRAGAGVIAGLCLSLCLDFPAHARTPSPAPKAIQKGAVLTTRASGTFEVKVTPQATDGKAESAPFGRMYIEGTSRGEMLTAGTDVEGSAAYVAIERVSGRLKGRSGTFVLQHSGTMTRGAPQLTITVVPDSGTGQLAGLAGRMSITIADGKHSYELEYTITETP
jgi:hypothetical protein